MQTILAIMIILIYVHFKSTILPTSRLRANKQQGDLPKKKIINKTML